MVNGKDEETEIFIQGLTSDFYKQIKLNCGAASGASACAARAISLFDVQRWTFDVRCLIR
jgi:hypothetical protein